MLPGAKQESPNGYGRWGCWGHWGSISKPLAFVGQCWVDTFDGWRPISHVCTGVNQATVKRMQIKLFQSSDKSISVTDVRSLIVRLPEHTARKKWAFKK